MGNRVTGDPDLRLLGLSPGPGLGFFSHLLFPNLLKPELILTLLFRPDFRCKIEKSGFVTLIIKIARICLFLNYKSNFAINYQQN